MSSVSGPACVHAVLRSALLHGQHSGNSSLLRMLSPAMVWRFAILAQLAEKKVRDASCPTVRHAGCSSAKLKRDAGAGEYFEHGVRGAYSHLWRIDAP